MRPGRGRTTEPEHEQAPARPKHVDIYAEYRRLRPDTRRSGQPFRAARWSGPLARIPALGEDPDAAAGPTYIHSGTVRNIAPQPLRCGCASARRALLGLWLLLSHGRAPSTRRRYSPAFTATRGRTHTSKGQETVAPKESEREERKRENNGARKAYRAQCRSPTTPAAAPASLSLSLSLSLYRLCISPAELTPARALFRFGRSTQFLGLRGTCPSTATCAASLARTTTTHTSLREMARSKSGLLRIWYSTERPREEGESERERKRKRRTRTWTIMSGGERSPSRGERAAGVGRKRATRKKRRCTR